MDTRTFGIFRDLIEQEAGIKLADEKRQLLANRIQKRIRQLGLSEERQYLEVIQTDATGEELITLIDLISTNVTFFWREHEHFELFGGYLKALVSSGQRSIKVWCAASSTGEEPYSLAITAAESIDLRNVELKILATDVCTRVLKKATEGIYESRQLEKLPHAYRNSYFTAAGEDFRIDPTIASYVTFKKLNLAKFPFPLKGPIDFIFCRNVMIYFDRPLRQQIVGEFERLMAPHGALFLSHSENLLGIDHKLSTRAVSVYERRRS